MAETESIDFSGTMIEKNLHTHTFRCKHADGDVQEYAKAALQAGLKVLGMSDHTPLPDGRWSTVRMGMEELDDYANAIRNARQAFPGLKILSGMECEWMPEYRSFYEEDLLGRLELDYLIGSVHYFPFKGEWRNVIDGVRTREELFSYTEWVIRTMETGLFSFIAHPDLFANSYMEWDEDSAHCAKSIFDAAKLHKVPLELNVSGYRKRLVHAKDGLRPMYPWKPFWKAAQNEGVEIIINSDAHSPKDIVAYMDRGQEMLATT